MAEPVYLALIGKVVGLVKGFSSQTSLEREDKIECVSFSEGMKTTRETGTRMATGKRIHEPMMIRKRIDCASPLLAQMLCNNEECSGTFDFYRPSPTGDGTTENFFKVHIQEARIGSISRVVPDCLDVTASAEPPTEIITFVYHTITWTYTDGGIEATDNWREST